MQQQQQRAAPSQIRFRPPFARIGSSTTPAAGNSTSWLGGAQQQAASKLAVNFSGTWIKDKAASESMSDAIALMGLGGLLRQAIKLIKGVKITQDDSSFTMAVFSVLTWFKVTERYSLDGCLSKCRRRDFRRGGHKGSMAAAGADKLRLNLQWDDPYGGTGYDVFSMPSKDRLYVDSSITVHGKTCSYRTVYNRKT